LSDFLSPDFLKFFVPLAGGVVGYLLNEHRKRLAEEYVRKEERYRNLILSLRGFYAGAEDPLLKREFASQVSLCWLYCSDSVIKAVNAFVAQMKEGSGATDQQKLDALASLIGTIRRDLLSRTVVRRTELTGREFERLSVIIQPTVEASRPRMNS
jgi:hypothetical protein